jgi:hypothetical protein
VSQQSEFAFFVRSFGCALFYLFHSGGLKNEKITVGVIACFGALPTHTRGV